MFVIHATLSTTDTMSKTIFRQKLTKNFTTIPNELLNNPNLSWKAKALLCYLLSLPPDWEIHLAHLKTVSTDGYDSTVAGVNELLENKYLWRRPRCGDEPGGWEYYVYQEPQFDNPFRDGNSPTREIPESEKSVATKETEEKERTKDKQKEAKQKPIDDEFLSKMKQIHGNIDVDRQLQKMDCWLAANPSRQKTRRFVSGWLNRCTEFKEGYLPNGDIDWSKVKPNE